MATESSPPAGVLPAAGTIRSVTNVDEPLDLIRLSLNERVHIKMRNDREIRGQLQGFDQHLNMVLSDVEETITTMELDEESYEEIVKQTKRKMTSYEEVVDFIERVQELEKALGVPPEGEEVRGDEVDVIGIKKLMQEKGLGFAMRAPVDKLKQLNNLIHTTEDDSSLETKLAIIEMQEGLVLKRCEQLKEVAALTDRLMDRKSFEVSDEQKKLLDEIAAEMEEAKLKAESRSNDVNEFINELSTVLSVLNKKVGDLEAGLRVLHPAESEA